MATRFDDQVNCIGGLVVGAGQPCVLPDGVISNTHVAASAAIAADKQEHRWRKLYAQNGTAAAATVALHYVLGATADINAFKVGVIGACVGNATISVDLLKEGTTVLSAPIVIDSSNAARVPEAGTISVGTAVADDLLEVTVAVDAGTGTLGTGLFCVLELDEDA